MIGNKEMSTATSTRLRKAKLNQSPTIGTMAMIGMVWRTTA